VFSTALLHSIGWTSHASENAALFADDTAFVAAFSPLDPGDHAVLRGQLVALAPGRQAELARRIAASGVRDTMAG
jgi:hypothetical protein